MKVEVLYFEGCPNHAPATELVCEALRKEGKRADVRDVEVHTPEQAQSLRFLGSPTIRINGVDVEPEARLAKTFGLGCRTYFTENGRSGTPSETMVRTAINEHEERLQRRGARGGRHSRTSCLNLLSRTAGPSRAWLLRRMDRQPDETRALPALLYRYGVADAALRCKTDLPSCGGLSAG